MTRSPCEADPGTSRISALPRWAMTFALLFAGCVTVCLTANAQFHELGPPPIPEAAAREQIKTLLEKVDAANRQQTVTSISGLLAWYRDLIDEELIAGWQSDGRATLPEVMESLADSRVATTIVEFSWHQGRQVAFRPAYAPLLEHLIARYPESAKPLLDDLLGPARVGQTMPDLSEPEAGVLCRILLDLRDVGTWKASALQILPHYRRIVDNLLAQDIRGSDNAKSYAAQRWSVDLQAADPAPNTQRASAQSATPPRSSQSVTAPNPQNNRNTPNPQRPTVLIAQDTPGSPDATPAPTPTPPGPAGPFRVGNGVSQPSVTFKVDPEYSEVARKLHVDGAVALATVVDQTGTARDIHVVKSLGYGLDEKAIEAVQKWKFKPGMKGGQPVNVRATIEVNFRLLVGQINPFWHPGRTAFALEAGVAGPVVTDGTLPPHKEATNESVVLKFTVTSSGSVKNIEFAGGSQSAAGLLSSNLGKWKFQPAFKNGVPVEVTGQITIIGGLGDGVPMPPLSTASPNSAGSSTTAGQPPAVKVTSAVVTRVLPGSGVGNFPPAEETSSF